MSLEIREWLIIANHYPRYYATVPILVLLRDVLCKKGQEGLCIKLLGTILPKSNPTM